MKNTVVFSFLVAMLLAFAVLSAGCSSTAAVPEPGDITDAGDETAEQEQEPEKEPEKEPEPESAAFITDALRGDIESGYLILVNKENGLDKNYKPDDLSDIKYYAADRAPEGRFMRAAAAEAFHLLVEEAGKNGFTLAMTTAYRSYDFQSAIYNNFVARDGKEAADRYSARPGHSEHQTGLAADVSSPSVDYGLTVGFAGTAEGKWLSDNAHLFGFIIRYPDGAEEITGYQYEPWHIRYVGAAAGYIYEHKITFEEYLQLLEKETEE